jgi:membrane fusion protein, multidrug efflux system
MEINLTRRLLGGLAVFLILIGIIFTNADLKKSVGNFFFGTEDSTPSKAGSKDKKKGPAALVRIAIASEGPVQTYLEGVGTVKARSTVDLKSQIEGQIIETLVHEGETVHKGDILFKLDPRPLKAKLTEIQATLAGAQASYNKAISDVQRLSNLSSKGYSPKTSVDEAKTQVDILAASVRATAAAVEQAQLNLDYATIKSPIEGRVGRILITSGNVVKPNDSQPLLIITEIKPVYASFGVPEQNIDILRKAMAETDLQVEVSTQSTGAPVALGRLFFINNQVDTQTGTIELLAQFENINERLTPGQFIRARIHLSTIDNAVLVPRRAVQVNQKGSYLWVVAADNTVELRRVEMGPDQDDKVSVLKGLKAGESVVTDGQLKLFVGANVQIVDDTAPAKKQAKS